MINNLLGIDFMQSIYHQGLTRRKKSLMEEQYFFIVMRVVFLFNYNTYAAGKNVYIYFLLYQRGVVGPRHERLWYKPLDSFGVHNSL
jgi:hypothetical protein